MYLQINAWILPRRYAPRQDDVFSLFNELVGHDSSKLLKNRICRFQHTICCGLKSKLPHLPAPRLWLRRVFQQHTSLLNSPELKLWR